MTTEPIPSDVLTEAAELTRGAEVLPSGIVGLAEQLHQARQQGRPLRVKLGVDPTSAHLHLGHAVVFRALRRFQERGHQAVILIGGFTARIGDPTGRNATRPSLSAEEVAHNARTFLLQLRPILDMDKVEVVDNASWFDTMSMPEMMKLAGNLTVGQLLAKEDFGNRIEAGTPLGLHEFMYPLLQGFDSVKVQADVEIGGTDQRFNLLMGRQLQPAFGQKPQVAMMLPILEGIDGKRKMSKTFGNAIALDDSADEIVSKCMRLPDELVLKFFLLATNMDDASIEAERLFLAEKGNPKEAKERLAIRIATELRDADQAAAALRGWNQVHVSRQLPDVIPERVQDISVDLPQLLVNCGMASSKTNARQLIGEGAVRIDGEKVSDLALQVLPPQGGSIVLQVGRKKFVRLTN